MINDLTFALRTLRRTPGFTAVVVLTLALGIGANGTIFGVINAVLLRALPYRDPAGLVAVYESDRATNTERASVAAANYRDWRERSRAFARMAMYRDRWMVVAGPGEPERLNVVLATGDFFAVLGVPPALGRAWDATEDRPGAAQSVVVSDALWRRRFGGDPRALGQTVTLDGRAYVVSGVMPASFRFPAPEAEAWVALAATEDEMSRRGSHNYNVVARLRPGVTAAQARREMIAIAGQIAAEHPEQQRDLGATVVPLAEDVAGMVRPLLLVLAGAVGFVLLIACANVANLYLVRAAGRRKEIAIRSAIGAGAGRVVRQLLVEALVLAALGGVVGLLLAAWGTRAVAALRPVGLPRAEEVSLDWRVAAFTAALSLATGLLFGLAPARQATRADLNDVLKDGLKGTSAGPGRARARAALLVAEVAVSLVLLAGAGLMLKSFARLQGVEPGFAADGLLTARYTLPATSYDGVAERAAFHDALLAPLRALPGVRGAALVSALPLSGQNASWGYLVEGRALASPADMPVAVVRAASADYFRTMGIPLRRGRAIEPRDRAGAPRVAVVNETLARQHFPGEDPVGKVVHPGGSADEPPFTIVGVVGDTKHLALDEAPRPQMYLPLAQIPDEFSVTMVALRVAGDPMALAAALRREVRALDAGVPLSDVRTMEELIASGVSRQRLGSGLLTGFAGLALVLAAVGIYGVVAHASAQRAREFGVRMALGAARADVMREVLLGVARLAGAGVAIGVVLALLATGALATQLYGVSAADPAVLAGVSALLALVALLAGAVPAWRATRIDPATALRAD